LISAWFGRIVTMRGFLRLFVAVVSLVALVAVGCSATTTVTDGDLESASGAGVQPDEAGVADEQVAGALDESDDVGASESGDADSGSSTNPPNPASEQSDVSQDPQLWDAEIKAERRARFDQTVAEIHDVFRDEDFPAETEMLPSSDFQQLHATGETVHMTLTIERVDAPDRPVVITAYGNQDTDYEHVIVDRAALANLRSTAFARDFPESAPQGTTETVSVMSSPFGQWSRGLVPNQEGAIGIIESDRWYSAHAVSSEVSVRAGFSTEERFWGRLDVEPVVQTDSDGNSVMEATLPDRSYAGIGVAATNEHTSEAVRTLRTVFSSTGELKLAEVVYGGDPVFAKATLKVESRREPIPVPSITDVVKDPFRVPTYQSPSEDYSWTATGTFQDSADASVEGPWSAEGRINEGFYGGSLLTMTAADVAVLAQLDSISVDDDVLVRRWGFDWVHSIGVFAEIAPDWADRSRIDPKTLYSNYDPFRVPADLFPSGLGEEQQWISFRTVPEIITRDGWDNHRVTTGTVDTDYWAYRNRLGGGIFGWIGVESADEIFTITIGADSSGRVQRVEVQTADPDGGSIVFDVGIEPEPLPGLKWTDVGSTSSGGIPQNPNWQPPVSNDEVLASFDDFALASRADYPTFDHGRSPEHLTYISTRVMDEPSGAYTPTGHFYTWTNGPTYVASIEDGNVPRLVSCLELEDNEWRFTENDLEKLWRAYDDGSSLDGVTLRTNGNAWWLVDVYATEGDRHPGDPCASFAG